MKNVGIAGIFLSSRRLEVYTTQKKQLYELSVGSLHICGVAIFMALFSLCVFPVK